jgi:hypothetical protein
MSGDIDSRAVWDDGLAHNVLGKVILVGLTYLSVDGKVIEQQQFMGPRFRHIREKGSYCRWVANVPASTTIYPPIRAPLEAASPGEYRLRATGEILVDSDYTVMFTISRQV